MREIKFRAWDKRGKSFVYFTVKLGKEVFLAPDEYSEELCLFTGLNDKNGMQYIYECDIIGVDGLIRGNKYENPELLQDTTNLVIEGFGTKDWWVTYKEAMARGCKDSE